MFSSLKMLRRVRGQCCFRASVSYSGRSFCEKGNQPPRFPTIEYFVNYTSFREMLTRLKKTIASLILLIQVSLVMLIGRNSSLFTLTGKS